MLKVETSHFNTFEQFELDQQQISVSPSKKIKIVLWIIIIILILTLVTLLCLLLSVIWDVIDPHIFDLGLNKPKFGHFLPPYGPIGGPHMVIWG